jgi:hypothetical protein
LPLLSILLLSLCLYCLFWPISVIVRSFFNINQSWICIWYFFEYLFWTLITWPIYLQLDSYLGENVKLTFYKRFLFIYHLHSLSLLKSNSNLSFLNEFWSLRAFIVFSCQPYTYNIQIIETERDYYIITFKQQ